MPCGHVRYAWTLARCDGYEVGLSTRQQGNSSHQTN